MLASFVIAISGTLHSQLIAIDGKTLRHSFDNADPSTSLHLIRAWAADNQLTLGKLAVDGKSNEVTAVPELLDRPDLEGHIVSLDAMGCHKSIARKLDMAHTDYLLALKANHAGLRKRAEEYLSSPGHLRHTKQQGGTLSTADESNRGHGRFERRVVLVTDNLWWIDQLEREDWPGLRSVVCVASHREQVGSGEKSVQKCNCLTSLVPDASRLQQLIRQHWSIENQCHWELDVSVQTGYHAQRLLARQALDENVLESILFPRNSK